MDSEFVLVLLGKSYHKITGTEKPHASRYHRTKCGLRQLEDMYSHPLHIEKALESSYTPCRRCYPQYNGSRAIHWSQYWTTKGTEK